MAFFYGLLLRIFGDVYEEDYNGWELGIFGVGVERVGRGIGAWGWVRDRTFSFVRLNLNEFSWIYSYLEPKQELIA